QKDTGQTAPVPLACQFRDQGNSGSGRDGLADRDARPAEDQAGIIRYKRSADTGERPEPCAAAHEQQSIAAIGQASEVESQQRVYDRKRAAGEGAQLLIREAQVRLDRLRQNARYLAVEMDAGVQPTNR